MIPVCQPQIGEPELQAVTRVLRSGWLTQGAEVAAFEHELGYHFGHSHAVACSSGTTALHLALAALGIGVGDEVLVPDFTFVATANAVRYTGATPVLVDVDERTWGMSATEARKKITARTKAILCVHTYGVPCDMPGLLALADWHGLMLVEDAAEGLGGSAMGTALGAIGHVGTLSFYGNKVVTCGEGGACVTQSATLAEKMRWLRGQAQDPERRYFHTGVGFNYRMTEMQAAIGRAQLSRLPAALDDRRRVCERYHARLGRVGFSAMTPGTPYAPWVFTLRLPPQTRERTTVALARAGVDSRPGFSPLHWMPMYYDPSGAFPVADALARDVVSLPTYVGMADQLIDFVCDVVEGSCQ